MVYKILKLIGVKSLVKSIYLYRASRQFHKNRFVFILGVMRSGSSLLVQLLTTNPSIIGYGEAHIIYQNLDSLKFLMAKNLAFLRYLFIRKGIYLDKLLHNRYLPDLNLLQYQKLKVIFILREPESCISSLLRAQWPEWSTVEQASNYYLGRLDMLKIYAETIDDRSRSFLLTYSDITQRTHETLIALQDYLEVEGGFSKEYEANKFSGILGRVVKDVVDVGDPFENLRRGEILKNLKYELVSIPEDLLLVCKKKYDEVLQLIKSKSKYL